jgi:phage tail-like protein
MIDLRAVSDPFIAFNFRVDIRVSGIPGAVCSAAFQECDGLEMTMEAKTIRQGGDNARQIRLAGPVSYGQLTLKRGMSASFDLWQWFGLALTPGKERVRGDALVTMLAADGVTERVSFHLTRCLPIKLKAPALSGKDGTIAIEEMQIAYEHLAVVAPGVTVEF